MIDLLKAKEEQQGLIRTQHAPSPLTIKMHISNVEEFSREDWESAYIGLEAIVQQILEEKS